MSTGSVAIPLLKAAPEPDQLTDRLAGGSWRGLELCLGPQHVSDEAALARTIEVVRELVPTRRTRPSAENWTVRLLLLAEAPVSWPSGAFVSVDRLDDEARVGIERSARFASAIGSPVLTIHLFTPQDPVAFRERAGPGRERGRAVPDASMPRRALRHGVRPLIENVPPVLRMRTGGVYLSPVGGHWRDLRRLARADAGAWFHDRHLPRGAVSLVRRRLSEPLRARIRR